MDRLSTEFAGKATFICVNTRSVDDAKAYKQLKELASEALVHGAGKPPTDYGLRYIPHQVVIDATGKVVKNFDNIDVARDVGALL
mmetsp:Transcript_20214/g.57249  ORF Transcript_20214/g.57249 Transcript_20214/m.57249 type:complete len:85 (-) Transcript_20214:67-321(-)